MIAINWKPSHRELRKFGVTLLIGFGVIGGVLFWKHPRAAFFVWAAAGAVGLLALVGPKASRPFYWVWMGAGFAVGSVVSRLVLLVIFYLVLTPVALVFKITGRDELRLKRKGGETTCWENHPKIDDLSYYEHLF